jgi:heavy metal sensor kinase
VINLRPRRLRTRLVLWYVLSLAIILGLYLCSTSLVLLWQLRAQLHRHAVQDLETVEGLLFFTPDGRLQFHEDYHNHPESRLVQERFLEVVAPNGTVLYRNDRLGNRPLGGKPLPSEGRGGYSPRSARLSDGTPVFLIGRRHVLDGHPLVIRVAYSEEPIWRTLEKTLIAQLSSLLLILVLAGLTGYVLVRRGLAPLGEMALRAQQITADRLHERLEIDGTGEIADLARAFNSAVARLEQSFDQLQRFTSDASHELRTPLAAIRSVGEVGLQKDRSQNEYREIIGSMLEEVNHLTRLIDSLLTLSRADAGQLKLRPSVFSVFDLAQEAAGLIEILAEEKAQKLILEGDERAAVHGDRIFLRQAIVNILHNAVKYSPVGGTITVQVRRDAGWVLVQVADTGSGIPPEHQGRVFERFYRVDRARSRDAGGVGLGLPIAKWAVQAHGGDITVNNNPGGGCTFQIQVPLAQGSSERTSGTTTTLNWTKEVCAGERHTAEPDHAAVEAGRRSSA